ncbi:MAG TPA: phosphatidylglycerophosphatase A [Pseudohongiella sp.]|nr:phosphatidylglycerophosphatase A [Pseudohongiella sp.]HBX35844.1 phosphatidylglycerophosphatase A [Pseudohongiella sp.]|tara:strand:- start:43 stop:519 length:477 start_codon:yes stop_codon:yes gene_type:complete
MAATPASVWRNPIHFLAFGLGSGAAPVAPGTFGTLAAVLIYLALPSMDWMWYLLMLLLTFVAGVWICGKTADDIGVHDHGGIVWDEFVGLWLTMFLAPPGWVWLVLGFVLFRIFDVLKPWPIRWLDRRVAGGFGIMIDDILAGIFALLCLQIAAAFFA